MTVTIGRRELLAALGGAAAAWPLAARAQQQPERIRRIGVLLNITADDPESQTRLAAFAQGLQSLGWIIGQNVRVEYRWGGGSADAISQHAAELVATAPDVILAQSTAAVSPLVRSQLGPATSRAWRVRGATPRALPASNTPSRGSGWNS